MRAVLFLLGMVLSLSALPLPASLAQDGDYKQTFTEARTLERDRDFVAAAEKYRAAADSAATVQDKAVALLGAARVLGRTPETRDQVMDVYQEIIDLEAVSDVHYSMAKIGIGERLYSDRQYDEAQQHFEALLADPRVTAREREKAQLFLGHIDLYHRKAFDAARANYAKVVTDDTPPGTQVIAQMAYAETFDRERRYEEAITELRKALTLSEQVPVYQPRVLMEMGSVYRRMDQFDEARQAYEQVLALNTPHVTPLMAANARLNIGLTHADEGNADEARQLLEAVLTDPASNDALKKQAQTALDKLK